MIRYDDVFDFTRSTILQGDVALIPVTEFPITTTELGQTGSEVVVAHSETGHHHVVRGTAVEVYHAPDDPSVMLIEVHQPGELQHDRDEHRHESQVVEPGKYIVQRQVNALQKVNDQRAQKRIWLD